MKKAFYAVGHITDDLEPSSHVGGGVSYSGFAAKQLGYDVHIITKCPAGHPYIDELESLGITMHVLPIRNPDNKDRITSFNNRYDEKGNRTQLIPDRQEEITLEDLENFPPISKDSVIFMASVADEIDTALFPELKKYGDIAVTPQGFFRHIGPNKEVILKPWQNASSLSNVKITIMSEEDLTFDKEEWPDNELFDQIKKASEILVVTRGENGSTIFENGKEMLNTKAFRLERDEVKDLTGAGDTYAAVFITRYEQVHDLKEASVFASLYVSMKIMDLEGKGGILAAPPLEKVQEFVSQNPERFSAFLKENDMPGLSIFPEGNQSPRKEML